MSPPTARPRRMSSGARLVVAVVLSLVLGGVSAVAVLAAAVYHAGTVDVEVLEANGNRISISVPTTIVTAAVGLVPDRVFGEAAEEVATYWPACQAAVRELGQSPDAVFVSVTGPDFEVRVAKEDGALLVDVQDGGDRVHVSIPIKTVVAIVEKINPGSIL